MMQRIMDAVFLSGLAVLPKNLMSRCMGRLVSIQWPPAMAHFLVKRFARIFKVNVAEAKAPLNTFDSIQSFFIRELKEGVRVFNEDSDALCAPCDGAWGTSGRVENGTLLQIKGRPYSLDLLLGGQVSTEHLDGAHYATLYLSPKDYHRFHAPMDLQIHRAWYLPGYLWPVSGFAVRGIDGLFAVNERIVMEVSSPMNPSRKMWIIAVGATNVGKIVLGFSDMTSNIPSGKQRMVSWEDAPICLNKGDYLGHFCFGSTLVLVMDPEMGVLQPQPFGDGLKLGETLGKLI